MKGGTREYEAIVWIKGSEQPPVRLTVEAGDEAEARERVLERFGEQIFMCSVWNEEELSKTWTRPTADTAIKEYEAMVWTNDRAKPGWRVSVHARNLDEARTLLEEQFGKEIACSIWNEEDSNRAR